MSNVIQFNGGRLMDTYKKRVRESIHHERDEKRINNVKYVFILASIPWIAIIIAIKLYIWPTISKLF